MASLNNLIKQRENQADTRMAEMSAVMKERDRQADERLKLMTDLMQRRETDADARMIDLMTTMKDLTLGVRALASQTVAAQAKAAPAAPIAPHPSNLPSTSAVPPPMQATYRKVALPSVEQSKPLKLIPPATYKRDLPKTSKMARILQTESRDIGTDPLFSISFDPYAHGASTTGDYYSPPSGMSTRESNYHTARTTASTNRPKQTYIYLVPRPVATSTQRKFTTKRILEQDPSETGETPEASNPTPDTPRTSQRQALAEAISTAMSKGLEALLAAKESKNKPTKYRGTKDGNADGWMMLLKCHLEKAHAMATPLDKAWTIIEYLEHEARDYITNKSEAERDTDVKVFALLARRFGTGSSKIHIQQQFRTRNQNSEEDYMQYLDALEGLRSQGYPNEEVTVRRYEIMQKFIEGVRNFDFKRNLALMYAPEQYVEAPLHCSTIPTHAWLLASRKLSNGPSAATTTPTTQSTTETAFGSSPFSTTCSTISPTTTAPTTCAIQTTTSKSMFQLWRPITLCKRLPLRDRARIPVQQQVNSCHTNPSGGWTCTSQPHGINNEVHPRVTANPGNCSLLRHLWLHRTLSTQKEWPPKTPSKKIKSGQHGIPLETANLIIRHRMIKSE